MRFLIIVNLIYKSIAYLITVGKQAPFWEGTAVVDGEFQDIKLTDFQGKYLVFFFYPLDL